MENELFNNVIKFNVVEKAKVVVVIKCFKFEEEMKKLKGIEVKEKWIKIYKIELKFLYIYVYVLFNWCGSLIDKWLCVEDIDLFFDMFCRVKLRECGLKD